MFLKIKNVISIMDSIDAIFKIHDHHKEFGVSGGKAVMDGDQFKDVILQKAGENGYEIKLFNPQLDTEFTLDTIELIKKLGNDIEPALSSNDAYTLLLVFGKVMLNKIILNYLDIDMIDSKKIVEFNMIYNILIQKIDVILSKVYRSAGFDAKKLENIINITSDTITTVSETNGGHINDIFLTLVVRNITLLLSMSLIGKLSKNDIDFQHIISSTSIKDIVETMRSSNMDMVRVFSIINIYGTFNKALIENVPIIFKTDPLTNFINKISNGLAKLNESGQISLNLLDMNNTISDININDYTYYNKISMFVNIVKQNEYITINDSIIHKHVKRSLNINNIDTLLSTDLPNLKSTFNNNILNKSFSISSFNYFAKHVATLYKVITDAKYLTELSTAQLKKYRFMFYDTLTELTSLYLFYIKSEYYIKINEYSNLTKTYSHKELLRMAQNELNGIFNELIKSFVLTDLTSGTVKTVSRTLLNKINSSSFSINNTNVTELKDIKGYQLINYLTNFTTANDIADKFTGKFFNIDIKVISNIINMKKPTMPTELHELSKLNIRNDKEVDYLNYIYNDSSVLHENKTNNNLFISTIGLTGLKLHYQLEMVDADNLINTKNAAQDIVYAKPMTDFIKYIIKTETKSNFSKLRAAI